MRKFCWIIVLALAVAACKPAVQPTPEPEPGPGPGPEPGPVDETLITDSLTISYMWQSAFADEATVGDASVVSSARWALDGAYQPTYKAILRTSASDLRYEFYSQDYMRFVSEGDGYALSIPLELEPKADYTLAKYGQRFYSDKFNLRVTLEHVTPYTPNEHYYGIYTGEWLDRYISNQNYINQNDMKYISPTVIDDQTLIDGYSVNIYSINALGLDVPLYKIALVRPLGQWSKFGFLLYKCSSQADVLKFASILKSFRVIGTFGRSKNFLPPQEPRPNPKWNEETKAYYNKLLNQNTLDFGVFSASMVHATSGSYATNHARIAAEKERLEAAFGHSYEIMPTYTHLAWGITIQGFPLEMANEFAGGNGFNGKPVLNLTYQFTTTNNAISGYTPMFDILRGNYDDHFRRLANDIKAYGKPVVFRLNNEMNTDWTSYSGIVTLLDPDIFVETWRRLYDIFAEEGVDNCIWVFNPITVTCPYCDWGEFACYYPGADYCQMLGLTYYEPGNSSSMDTFRNMYTKTYNTYKDYFIDYPWMIGEFACGAGGAKLYSWGSQSYQNATQGRSETNQANWCREMFKCFADNQSESNRFCRNIKIAIWFSANDYVSIDGTNYVLNYYKLDEALDKTFAVFREWLPKMHH